MCGVWYETACPDCALSPTSPRPEVLSSLRVARYYSYTLTVFTLDCLNAVGAVCPLLDFPYSLGSDQDQLPRLVFEDCLKVTVSFLSLNQAAADIGILLGQSEMSLSP